MSKDAKSTAPVMATPSQDGTSLRVPMAKIIVGKEWNSRQFLTESAVDTIADSFKKQGQITPIRLSPRADGKYDLVSGFTRYAAAKKLGWDVIEATVSTNIMSDEQRRIENLVENEVRRDLTPYEQAYAYRALSEITDDKSKKAKFSQQAIADMAGKSQSYVSRLIQATELLAPKVLEQWAKDCQAMANGDDKHTPVVNTHDLKGLVKVGHKEQLEWLEAKLYGEPETDEDDGEGDDSESKIDTVPRMSTSNVKRALAAAEAALKDAKNTGEHKYFEGVINALKFALRDGRSIEGVCKYKRGEEGKGGKVVTASGEAISAPRDGKAKVQASA